jgi:putative transposase
LVDQRNSKKEEKTFKVRWIYQSIGISKQAYSQRLKADLIRDSEKEKVIAWLIEYRKKLPKTGTCKLYEYLIPILKENDIKMGRSALNDLLRNRGMLVKKTKRFHITTDSKHFYYKSPNLLTDKEITHSEQVFVSDITYVKTDEGHAYLALVTVELAKKMTAEAVTLYNNERMHWSLDFKKPQEGHSEYNLQPNKIYKKEKKNEVKSNLKT